MCPHSCWPAFACLLACFGLVHFLARLDAWREQRRQERLLDEALTRHEQAQHRWVESPVVDVERRG